MKEELWPPGDTLDDGRRWWARRPGWRLAPSETPATHWFGRSSFEAPACPSCGHKIIIWFDLDVAAIPELKISWPRLPMLACIDCLAWMHVHHYRVDQTKMIIELLEFERPRQYEAWFNLAAEIVPRPVALEKIAQLDAPAFSMVGGRPYWYQRPGLYPADDGMPECRDCTRPMIYAACRNDLSDFLETGADDGMPYQYHFVCGDCERMTVFSHWS